MSSRKTITVSTEEFEDGTGVVDGPLCPYCEGYDRFEPQAETSTCNQCDRRYDVEYAFF